MDRGFFRGYRTHHNFVMPIFVISIFPPDYSPRTYLKKKAEPNKSGSDRLQPVSHCDLGFVGK